MLFHLNVSHSSLNNSSTRTSCTTWIFTFMTWTSGEYWCSGIRHLDGEYTIRLDPTIQSVQHSPRCIALTRRPKLEEALNNLVDQAVIVPVAMPTKWISSIMAVLRPNKTQIVPYFKRTINLPQFKTFSSWALIMNQLTSQHSSHCLGITTEAPWGYCTNSLKAYLASM